LDLVTIISPNSYRNRSSSFISNRNRLSILRFAWF